LEQVREQEKGLDRETLFIVLSSRKGAIAMRFVLLYKSGKTETNKPPSPKEMEAVGKLVQEMAQAGVLLGTEGFEPSAKGARVRINSGKFSVSEGPFTEGNGLLDGYAVVKVNSKTEAIEWSQRFLAAVGEGESEIRQLREMPGSKE